MTIAQLTEKMIAFYGGSLHDIDHFLRVWAYAKTIGEQEGLDVDTQFVLEAAAVTHDIACPLCREKYGSTDGRRQEEEGVPLVRAFLADTGMTQEQISRVAFLVGSHHTLTGIDRADHQILVEADYIANASEKGYSRRNMENFMQKVMKTQSGRRLLKAVFRL